MIKREDIQIRDPFVLSLKEQGKYYLYGTTDKNAWEGKAGGFDAYCSSDLENWHGPIPVFRPDKSFWADENFWAPEVYYYNGKYYMFASFKTDGSCRGTQILVSESPEGPFIEHSNGPVTPEEWECLDGTFYVDSHGQPWMVFCREWLQVKDGRMYAVKLDHDLNKAVGEPVLLFSASEAVWSCYSIGEDGNKNYITDGPFLYKTKNGQLLMLWSTMGYEGYTIGIARSESKTILGPWKQEKTPLFSKDGGHGMIFKTFENKLMLTIHMPNNTPNERPAFFELKEVDDELKLK